MSRRRLRFVGLLLAALSLPAHRVTAQVITRPSYPRGIWTWEQATLTMVASERAALDAIAFFERKGVTAVYLYADDFAGRNLLRQQPERVRAFIRLAHGRDIQVRALLGSIYLHTERYVLPSFHPAAVSMLQRVLDYNAAAEPAARFDGVNYDIEPHILRQWGPATRADLLRGFLDMTAAMLEARHRSGQVLPIGPAIPFWWDEILVEWRGVRKPASEHIIDLTDYVTLMDYRDRADGDDSIISHAQRELAYADRVGKRVEIGLEFGPATPAKVTFSGESEAVFEREAAKVAAVFGGRPAFGGLVLHHYDVYRRFVREPARRSR